MLKPEEQIKLNNFQAQYESILGNIRIANSELEKSLEAEKDAKKSIGALTAKVNELSTEVSLLLVKRDSTIKELDNKLALVERRESEAAQKESHTSKYVDSELARLEKERITLDMDIVSKTKEVSDLNAQVTVLNDSVRVMGEQVSSLSARVAELSKEVSSLERAKATLAQQVAEDEQEHAVRTKEMLEEIAEIQRITKEEKDKMVMSADFYKKKDEEYAGRERDILIVTKRLKTLFNEIKPGTNLKI